jgi:hypothetical protein
VFTWQKVVHVDGSETAFEGRFLEAKGEQKHPQRKDVHLACDGVARVEIDLLRRSVHWSGVSLDVLGHFIAICTHGLPDYFCDASEVAQFERTLRREQNVLHLHVTVSYP